MISNEFQLIILTNEGQKLIGLSQYLCVKCLLSPAHTIQDPHTVHQHMMVLGFNGIAYLVGRK